MSLAETWPNVVLLDPLNQGLALARSMVRLGARVAVIEPRPIVARSRKVRGIQAAYEPGGRGPWLQALEQLAHGSGRTVVLTGSDRASEWLVDAAAELAPSLHLFERAGSAHLSLMHKERAEAIARRAGVPVPWTASVSSEEQLERLAAEAPWPCVVKPSLSHLWRERYGEQRVFRVEDRLEALAILRAPLREGVEMLISQYIPGGDRDVEEAIVVRLADGSYPVRFGCRKLLQSPPGFGATAVGESSPLPETMELAQRLLDEAGYVGVAGVETKRHAATGERWFLEVNVRLPAQWGLGDACGAQASSRLVAALSGMSLGPAPPPRPGVRFVQPDLHWHDVAAELRAEPHRAWAGTVWRALRPYIGARELGVLDPRDPGPLLAIARAAIGRRAARLSARRRRGRESSDGTDEHPGQQAAG